MCEVLLPQRLGGKAGWIESFSAKARAGSGAYNCSVKQRFQREIIYVGWRASARLWRCSLAHQRM